MNMKDYVTLTDALLDLVEAQKLEIDAYKKLTRLYRDKFLALDEVLANRRTEDEESKETEAPC